MVAPVGPGSHGGDGAEGGESRPLHDFVARARGLRHRDELDRVAIAALSALESAGIEAVLLKGPALARRLYAEGEARGYSDVDLLVRRSNLAAAGESLEKLGYVRIPMFGIDDVAGVQHSEVWGREGERGGPIQIDLHWRLDGCEAPDDLIWEALVAARGSVELRGREVPVLADDGLALHLALHAAQHGPNDSKAIGDLARGIERWPPDVWRRAGELAERVQGVAAFAAGLRLLGEGATIARELGLPPTPELDWKIHHRDGRPRGTFHLRAMADARGAKERANVLRRSLFPTPRWIRWEYKWAARGRALLLLAYARHILRAPLWAAKAGRFAARARRAGGRG
jgi:hypothetical protein